MVHAGCRSRLSRRALQNSRVQDVEAIDCEVYNLIGSRGELPEPVNAAAASWNTLPLCKSARAFGRVPTESKDDGTVVIDPRIVGRKVHLMSFTVLGVLRSWFRKPSG